MSDCIFCKIVKKEVPSQVVYEDDRVMAFKDINPVAPVHVLIIPKVHVESIMELDPASDVLKGIVQTVQKLSKEQGIAQDGFRVVVNCGPAAGQTVNHLHFHLIGGRNMGWPPG
ncbi:histidine triad nucleotide-binding protein [Caldanaerobius polysaccharolyticus]|uniref:histidine triad nucleotide-binding protein n=1 Tax=Caldanaerobius polysaccharolyticus TaxID=44256 RepID=UPI00047D55BE|nr:histidine triad nucleotide-binding protein [Caldanaerobius polysaccharolyticus]